MDGTNVYTYEQTARLVDVISNRVSVINQILGCRYDFAWSNPVTVVARRGRLKVKIFGVTFKTARLCDSDQLDDVVVALDLLKSALWLMSRGGVEFSGIR